jgi:hypothetical protein
VCVIERERAGERNYERKGERERNNKREREEEENMIKWNFSI